MIYQTQVLSVLGSANILFLLIIALKLSAHYKQNPLGLRKFLYLVLAAAVFSIYFMGTFWATDPTYLNIFLLGMFASQMCLSTLCLFFFMDMADSKNRLLKTAKNFLLFIIILHVIISLTNPFHHFLYTSAAKNLLDNNYYFEQGPWLDFMRYYSLFILFVNCYVILLALLGKNKKTFEITLCIFSSFAITGIISVFHDKGLLGIPYNPIGFFMSIPAFLIYYSCFEYLGKSRDKAIDFMEDSYFVFDLKGGLIDRNRSAENFIKCYCHDENFDIDTICRLVGVDDLKTFKEQEFSINNLGKSNNYFRAAYFSVSDSISQICGHGFLIREITYFKEQVNILNTAANIDPLTGARNRRYFDIYCKKLYKKYVTFNSNITLLMLDLDHFKKVNDTYGHSVGDEVLKAFAVVCLDNLRLDDILFRFGGEEFVVLIDGASPEAGKHAADRIRATMANQPIQTSKGLIPVTVSIGGCSTPTTKELDIRMLVEIADKLLYKAKNGGRDKVEFLDLKK